MPAELYSYGRRALPSSGGITALHQQSREKFTAALISLDLDGVVILHGCGQISMPVSGLASVSDQHADRLSSTSMLKVIQKCLACGKELT